MHVPIQGVNKLLEVELKWLLNVRVSTMYLNIYYCAYMQTVHTQRRLVVVVPPEPR